MKFYSDPVYIEMCAKAEEIQANLPDIDDAKSFWISNKDRRKRSIWLPRLDQLIEMLREKHITFIIAWDGLNFGIDTPGGRFLILSPTPEPTLLGLWMRERYGKRWTGEGWEVI